MSRTHAVEKTNEKLIELCDKIDNRLLSLEVDKQAKVQVWKILGYTLGICGSIATIVALIVSLI
jgi:hypothetical protein